MDSIDYFAKIYPAGHPHEKAPLDHIWENRYQVRLCDDSLLEIPLIATPDGQGAIALLMSNQCDFSVTDHLTSLMTKEAAKLNPDCIVAVPTMGLEYAQQVAKKLGHDHYVAMGFSHKFWYDHSVYEKIRSYTSSAQIKHLFLDPHLISRVKGKKVVLVDDVINTGTTMLAAIRLLSSLGAHVIASLLVLTETHAWKRIIKDPIVSDGFIVKGLAHIPLFKKHGQGWLVDQETL